MSVEGVWSCILFWRETGAFFFNMSFFCKTALLGMDGSKLNQNIEVLKILTKILWEYIIVDPSAEVEFRYLTENILQWKSIMNLDRTCECIFSLKYPQIFNEKFLNFLQRNTELRITGLVVKLAVVKLYSCEINCRLWNWQLWFCMLVKLYSCEIVSCEIMVVILKLWNCGCEFS